MWAFLLRSKMAKLAIFVLMVPSIACGTTVAGPTAEPPTAVPSPVATQEPSPTTIPTATLTPTITATATATLTPTIISTPTITATPTMTHTPTVTLPAVASVACIPTATLRQTGRVTRVADGDTIDVSIGGTSYRVRYIGMDTPETGMPFASQATLKNSELVAGKTVTLVKDVSETDRYNRLLRYVLVGETFVNYELVYSGFAQEATYPPDVACAQAFREAQESAREAERGLWAPIPKPATIAAPGGNCDPSYPTVCIPPPPPDLDCKDIPYRRFKVLPPDPHRFDGDHDGIGCES